MFRLHFGLDLYAGVRPVRLYARCPAPLRDAGAGIDYVIVRKNVEGLYAGRHGGSRVEGEVAADTSIISRAATTRIVEWPFALASTRSGASPCVESTQDQLRRSKLTPWSDSGKIAPVGEHATSPSRLGELTRHARGRRARDASGICPPQAGSLRSRQEGRE